MSPVDIKKDYIPYYPKTPTDLTYYDKMECLLITYAKQLEVYLNTYSDKTCFAIDTETTGLSYNTCEVVGISISFTDLSGIYIPIKHQYNNVDDVKSVLLKVRELLYSKKSYMFNSPFDTQMLKITMNKHDIELDTTKLNSYDVQTLVYIMDSNMRERGLKACSEHYLGRIAPSYVDTLGSVKNFVKGSYYHLGYLLPQEALEYAVNDSANTLGLANLLEPLVQAECPFIYKLDNELVRSFINYYTYQPVYINKDTMKELAKSIKIRVIEIEKKVFKKLGMFNIDSIPEKTKAFLRVGIDTKQRSENEKNKDQMIVNKDAIEELIKAHEKEIKEYYKDPEKFDEEDKAYPIGHPNRRIPYEVLALLLERSTLSKQLSTYIEKLSQSDTGYINYNLFRSETGRFTSGGSKNDFFINLNYQNLTKPKPQEYIAIHKTHPLYEKLNEPEILDYKFVPVKEYDKDKKPQPLKDESGNIIPDTDYFVEGQKQGLNVRSAITVPNSDFLYCVDKETTYIELEDLGRVLIKDLEKMDLTNLKVKTPDGYKKILNYFDSGKKQKCVLKLKDGRKITCSPEHKFLVKDIDGKIEWKMLKHIKSTDVIQETL